MSETIAPATENAMQATAFNEELFLKRIEETINQKIGDFEARVIEQTKTMINAALQEHPTLIETRKLIEQSQTAMQAQFDAQNKAVVDRVEKLVGGVETQLNAVHVMLARNEGLQSGLHRVIEQSLQTAQDTTRRVTQLEGENVRLASRFNDALNRLERLEEDTKDNTHFLTSVKDYFERQKALTDIRTEAYRGVLNIVKNPVFLRGVAYFATTAGATTLAALALKFAAFLGQ